MKVSPPMYRKWMLALPAAVLALTVAFGTVTTVAAAIPAPSPQPASMPAEGEADVALDVEAQVDLIVGIDHPAYATLRGLADSGQLPEKARQLVAQLLDRGVNKVAHESFSCARFEASAAGAQHPDLVALCFRLEADGWTEESLARFKTALRAALQAEHDRDFCERFRGSAVGQQHPDLVALCFRLEADGWTEESLARFKAAVRAAMQQPELDFDCERFRGSAVGQRHPDLVALCFRLEAAGWTQESLARFKAAVRAAMQQPELDFDCERFRGSEVGQQHPDLVALCFRLEAAGWTEESLARFKAAVRAAMQTSIQAPPSAVELCQRLAAGLTVRGYEGFAERCRQMLAEGVAAPEILKRFEAERGLDLRTRLDASGRITAGVGQ